MDTQIQFWNFETDNYESMGSWQSTIDEAFIEIDVMNEPERFVHPINQEIRARITWTSSQFTGAPFFWSVDVDTGVWAIDENLGSRSGNSGRNNTSTPKDRNLPRVGGRGR